LTGNDFDFVVNQTAAKFGDFVAGRTKNSPPMIITTEKVENETGDRIDEAKQWMFVLKVEGALPMQEVCDQHNVTFQIEPQRLENLQSMGYQGTLIHFKPPTHLLKARFKSSAIVKNNAQGYVNDRTDDYFLEYYLVELSSGKMVWDKSVEFARHATGVNID
jgi:hypothetical protein